MHLRATPPSSCLRQLTIPMTPFALSFSDTRYTRSAGFDTLAMASLIVSAQ